jgi:hypothetical protein
VKTVASTKQETPTIELVGLTYCSVVTCEGEIVRYTKGEGAHSHHPILLLRYKFVIKRQGLATVFIFH